MTSFTDIPLSELSGINSLHVLAIGGTGGLGRALSAELAKHGAKVTVVGRTFRDAGIENIEFVKADLGSIAESKKFASSVDVSKTDLVLFTTGIFSSIKREETSEGLEKDLATSFLNRKVILDTIGDKLTHKSELGEPRVFLMGYPGNGELGTPDDLNQENNYKFNVAHMNTVAGNECLVVDAANKHSNFKVFGMNPGLVKTNIRDNLLGTGILSKAIEGIVGWWNPTPEEYAQTVLPAMLSPKLKEYNGIHLSKHGSLLSGTEGITKDYASNYIYKADELLKLKGF